MDLVLLLVVAAGVLGLIAGVVGSLNRDAEFQRRYRAASGAERSELEKIRPSSLSWPWANSHSKPKWAVGVYAFLALVAVAAWWLER